MDKFKKHKILIVVTFLLVILGMWLQGLKPTYYAEGETLLIAIVATIIGIPLYAWWVKAVWNTILVELFPFKKISYGVSIILTAIMTVLIG